MTRLRSHIQRSGNLAIGLIVPTAPHKDALATRIGLIKALSHSIGFRYYDALMSSKQWPTIGFPPSIILNGLGRIPIFREVGSGLFGTVAIIVGPVETSITLKLN